MYLTSRSYNIKQTYGNTYDHHTSRYHLDVPSNSHNRFWKKCYLISMENYHVDQAKNWKGSLSVSPGFLTGFGCFCSSTLTGFVTTIASLSFSSAVSLKLRGKSSRSKNDKIHKFGQQQFYKKLTVIMPVRLFIHNIKMPKFPP